MNNKYLFIIIFLLILFPPNINNIRLNVKIIIALIGIIIMCNVNEGFGNIDAEALQNMASLYNSSTGILKVNNLEASGYISTNEIKPTVTNKNLNIKGPSGQTLALLGNNSKWIDIHGSNIHIVNSENKYKLFVSMPSEFRENIVAKKNITAKDYIYKISINQENNEEVSLTKYNIKGLKINIDNGIIVNLATSNTLTMSKEHAHRIMGITLRHTIGTTIYALLLEKYKIFKTYEDKENLIPVIISKISNKEYKTDKNKLTLTFT